VSATSTVRAAVDVGGTFTDLVYFSTEPVTGAQTIVTAKANTTPPEFERGLMDVVAKTGLSLDEVAFLVHGTTVVINALTERSGVVTGLITTEGFRDTLEIARGNRPDFFNLHYKKPPPFVPRRLRREVPGRLTQDGRTRRPLDLTNLPAILDDFRSEGVAAVAQAYRDAGMRAWHCGPLANSAATEAITSLLIFLNIRHKENGTGIKVTGLDDEPAKQLSLIALPDIPEVRPGDRLPDIIMAGLARADTRLADGDVVVIAQKVVSKSENRYANLADVEPSPRALEMAQRITKDPRIVELILRESRDVVRQREDLIVVEHRHGYVLANAGIDVSNLEPLDGQQRVLLLPENPDASAASIRAELEKRTGKRLAVVINDSLGRAWRRGTVGTALGASGLPTLLDMRGQPDRSGRVLRSTEVGVADEVAAAASLLMGQAAEGRPIVILRGFPYALEESNAAALIRSKEIDMFR